MDPRSAGGPAVEERTLRSLEHRQMAAVARDLNDAPDTMLEDFVLTFTVGTPDPAPFVVLESSTPSEQNGYLGGTDAVAA